MAILLALLTFVLLLAAITYFGYRRYARPSRMYEQLGGTAATYALPTLDKADAQDPGIMVWAFEQVGEMIPVNPDSASMIRGDLIAAGYRSGIALAVYVGIRTVACGLLLFLALVFRHNITSNPILAIVLPIAAALLGYFGPSFYLDHLVSARHDRIREGLPDALDLLVVSVEAGLGLDQALFYVGRELAPSHPDISEELQLVNLEIRAGKRRSDALHNLAERTREPELKKLVATLVQTDRFGTSIAESLRTHSDFMRTRRRQDAEERAGKVGVKLVFPIFFLILPSMVVVAAGPGLLQVFKYLFPMMKNSQM